MNQKEFLIWTSQWWKSALESTDIYMRFLVLLKKIQVFTNLPDREVRTLSCNSVTCIFSSQRQGKGCLSEMLPTVLHCKISTCNSVTYFDK